MPVASAQPMALPPMRGMIVAQRGDDAGKVDLDSDSDEGKEVDIWRLACAASSILVNGSLASNLDFSSDGVGVICDLLACNGLDVCDSSFS